MFLKFQVTVSDKKTKKFVNFTNWLQKRLGVSWEQLGASGLEHIHFFYTLLPYVAEDKKVKIMTPSFSWGPASDASKVQGKPITFGLLMPEKLRVQGGTLRL